MRSSKIPHILFIDNYSDSRQLIDVLLYTKECKYNFSSANIPSEAKLCELFGVDTAVIEDEAEELMSETDARHLVGELEEELP